MVTDKIQERYGSLAESSCCLSCGGAMKFLSIKEGDVCVDLGSGRGLDVLKMAGLAGETGHAYGIDVTDGMLEKAKSTQKKLSIANATFLKGELDRLPLPDSVADTVISNCTINHAPDKRAVYREIMRIMKPGAVFVVSDIYSTGEVDPLYAHDPVSVSECWGGAITRQAYMDAIASAGFRDVRILEDSLPYEKGKITVSSFTVSGRKEGT
jgi:arsenite methyltransferase